MNLTLSEADRQLAAKFSGADVFGPILQSIQSGPQVIRAAQVAQYVKDLKAHDWSFEYSDDHSVWGKGHNSLARLKLAQKELDADFAIWNEHAPAEFKSAPASPTNEGAEK